MKFVTATIVLLQAANDVAQKLNGAPDAPAENVGFVVPFEIVAIAVGVLVTFGLVYLVKRLLGEKDVA
ncbi:hypothetical protein FIV42_17655 [Persicimonas caeni]|uniref:Uncharacterized protein n=1 Tax=Persicimonas caeni TaxID=2292766 RepID=A0A4Y6PVZ1_PERCE|nr:hypothetical protein [Persicimonas caeni]QDG52496.1 hypothetical protein FIV42_17655 [Persicimonas caeni]QED33718.1 hypothetical protein FRD00_17650 [Persicimonas caeni]